MDRERTIAILGDVWHVRHRVPVSLQNRLLTYFELLWKSGIHVILLPGNHDQVNPAGENALHVFRNLPNVRVYSKPTVDDYGLWIPYRKDPKDIEEALKRTYTTGIVFMHHGVCGAMMNNTMADKEGLPLSMFQGARMVLCGHYHKRQQVGIVNYIGSPYQTRADEAGQVKGYAIWNHTQQILEFRDTLWGKRFHSYEVSEGSLAVPDGAKPEDELRVMANPGVDVEKLGQFLIAQGYKNVVITPRQAATEARLKVSTGASLGDYAEAFVDAQETPLDKERLMAVYREVTGA